MALGAGDPLIIMERAEMIRRALSFWLVSLLLPVLAAAPARAGGKERVTALEENDSLYFNSDRHYTQGVRFSYAGPDVVPGSAWNGPFDFLSGVPSLFEASGARRYALILGQSIYTPKEIGLDPPDPADRPYAAWLYAGAGLLQETGKDRLENAELLLGVVGPAALGREIQNDYHQLIDAGRAKGWASQIGNEPGLMLTYERFWRVSVPATGGLLDVVPGAGATVGNIMTYGEIGALFRIGNALGADYGPARVRPALSGTDYFDGDGLPGGFGYYVYGGAQARVVGVNIFLDGNSFRRSPSVDKKTFVADLQGGFALFWSDVVKFDFSVIRRSEEFDGQDGTDVIGTASAAFTW